MLCKSEIRFLPYSEQENLLWYFLCKEFKSSKSFLIKKALISPTIKKEDISSYERFL